MIDHQPTNFRHMVGGLWKEIILQSQEENRSSEDAGGLICFLEDLCGGEERSYDDHQGRETSASSLIDWCGFSDPLRQWLEHSQGGSDPGIAIAAM